MSEKALAETDMPKKRRFWQLHLSTAVLLMFGAGIGIFFNSQRRSREYELPRHARALFRPNVEDEAGYPLVFFRRLVLQGDTEMEFQRQWFPLSFVADLCMLLICLFAFAFLSESLLRRREGRKP